MTESELVHLISEYGKAMEASGRSGWSPGLWQVNGETGVQTEIEPRNITPEYTKACECWGKCLDAVKQCYGKSWWRRLLG